MVGYDTFYSRVQTVPAFGWFNTERANGNDGLGRIETIFVPDRQEMKK